MTRWIEKNGIDDINALIEYAHALITKYGEGGAALACQLYDAIAELQNVAVDAAIPAETASINEVAKAINGVMKQSPSGQLIETVVQRLVKQASADTTIKNAIRDKIEFAWIPFGDNCAFCITLASRGWQKVSDKALKNGHAEHIHSHCDCQYAIRFSKNFNISGYEPEKYLDMYNSYDGTPQEKINAMRRDAYEVNKDFINEQKRAAYAIRTGKEEA